MLCMLRASSIGGLEVNPTVDVEVEKCAVLVLARGSVQEIYRAEIPSLIRLANPRQVERRQSVVGGTLLRHKRNPAFVAVSDVQIRFVPYENRDLHPLWHHQGKVINGSRISYTTLHAHENKKRKQNKKKPITNSCVSTLFSSSIRDFVSSACIYKPISQWLIKN